MQILAEIEKNSREEKRSMLQNKKHDSTLPYKAGGKD